jgi:hypothetical protein
MPHTTTLEPTTKTITVTITGLWTEDDAAVLSQELKTLLPATGNRHLAIDLEEAVRYDGTEARRRTAKLLTDYGITHLAVYNARPAVRILVKILINLVTDATTAKFFPTREAAVAWLQQERTAQ